MPVAGGEFGGTWSTLTQLARSSLISQTTDLVNGMSCSSAETCTMVGTQIDFGNPAFGSSSLNSVPPLAVSSTSLPAATVGVPYSATLQASGGTGNDSWSISTGSLPDGLSLNPTIGVISGTPTTAGSACSDSAGAACTAALELMAVETFKRGPLVAVTAIKTIRPTILLAQRPGHAHRRRPRDGSADADPPRPPVA